MCAGVDSCADQDISNSRSAVVPGVRVSLISSIEPVEISFADP